MTQCPNFCYDLWFTRYSPTQCKQGAILTDPQECVGGKDNIGGSNGGIYVQGT